MSKSSAVLSLAFDARRGNFFQTIVIAIGLLVMMGMLQTNSIDEMIAYLSVTVASIVPVALWIQFGATGIPVMPAISPLFFIYYALPILRQNIDLTEFGTSEILSAAVTVVLFLGAATFSWWLLVAGGTRRSSDVASATISGSRLEHMTFFGLAMGVLYHIALYTGWLFSFGSALGLIRGALLSAAIAGCFMLGYARAQGSLRGSKWILAITGLSILILLSLASLFLISAMLFGFAAMFGYVITTRRVPWIVLSMTAAAVIVLHAGKDHMREKYWLAGTNSGAAIFSVTNVPVLVAEWVEAGIMTIGYGKSYSSAVDRASLLNLLMRVQRLTPDFVPFLEGKSYEVLPEMLVPRFLNPDKISSQQAMKMLNIRFGFQSREGSEKTAVGWGLIAEAYANFARLGVFGVGLLFGLFCGALERWSAGTSLISLPSLVAVVSMMVIFNIEMDMADLVTALFQSVIAIAVVFWGLKTMFKPKIRRRIGEGLEPRLIKSTMK